MDTPKVLNKEEALNLVRKYKKLIAPRFNGLARVMMFGSYSKGNPNPWSDIDVAVILPTFDGDWLETSVRLGIDGHKISSLLEPVLLTDDEWSPLYDDVMNTGIAI